MTEEDMIELNNYIKNDLKGIPFDKGLPYLRVKLWQIGAKYYMTGADVFCEYMEYYYSK